MPNKKNFTRKQRNDKYIKDNFDILLSPHAHEKHKQLENNFEEYLKEYNSYELLPTNKHLEFKSIGISEQYKLINVLLTNNKRYKININHYEKFKNFIKHIQISQFFTNTKILPKTFFVNENYDFIDEYFEH